MAGRAVHDHLALLARTGMMTHIAELKAPVTAESMRRFRTESAAQASNVMALGSGRFALCLGTNVRDLRTGVGHTLLPIEQALRGHPKNAAPPRSTLSEDEDFGQKRDEARARPTQVASNQAETITPLEGPVLGASITPGNQFAGPGRTAEQIAILAEGQMQIAQAVDGIAATVRTAEAEAAARKNAITSIIQGLEARLETALQVNERRMERFLAAIEARIAGQQEQVQAQSEATEARLAEGLEATHAAQMEAVAQLSEEIRGVMNSHAEEAARNSEAHATLRLGLRGMSDRMAEVIGTMRSLAEGETHFERRDPGVTNPAHEHDVADVTVLHPASAGADHGHTAPHHGSGDRGEIDRLRAAVGALLEHLDPSASTGSPPPPPMWRRHPLADPSERRG